MKLDRLCGGTVIGGEEFTESTVTELPLKSLTLWASLYTTLFEAPVSALKHYPESTFSLLPWEKVGGVFSMQLADG